MAKVSFSKLGLSKNQDIKIIKFNDMEIEVKQYLPVNDKLQLIANVLNNSADENNFANPTKVQIMTDLQIIFNYTNISFTEKQKEDIPKLYDLVITSGLYDEIYKAIPAEEMLRLRPAIQATIESYYKYRNSVLGILETISQDYSNLSFDSEQIRENLGDPENLSLLKDVLSKLG